MSISTRDPEQDLYEDQDPEQDPQETKERVRTEWMWIAIGLAGLLSVMAIVISSVALSSGSKTSTTIVTTPAPSAGAASAVPAVKPQTLDVAVKTDTQHGRLGPDKQWHDAFLPADYTVHAGATITVNITNYDSGPHTFTAPSLNLNATIPGGGSLSSPQHTTFTFKAPAKPGKYVWYCGLPCDPWAMAHDGYMRGVVTVTA